MIYYYFIISEDLGLKLLLLHFELFQVSYKRNFLFCLSSWPYVPTTWIRLNHSVLEDEEQDIISVVEVTCSSYCEDQIQVLSIKHYIKIKTL